VSATRQDASSPAKRRRWRVRLRWSKPMGAEIECLAYSESQAIA
jgi:hypothetical protein